MCCNASHSLAVPIYPFCGLLPSVMHPVLLPSFVVLVYLTAAKGVGLSRGWVGHRAGSLMVSACVAADHARHSVAKWDGDTAAWACLYRRQQASVFPVRHLWLQSQVPFLGSPLPFLWFPPAFPLGTLCLSFGFPPPFLWFPSAFPLLPLRLSCGSFCLSSGSHLPFL